MKQEDFTRRYSYDPVADLLGSGGFGKVFKAWDNDAECYVAIKMQSVDPRYPGLRLSEEVEKAARLRHPNVARYKECYTFSTMDGTKDIAVMSYYEDGSLDKLLASGKLGREDIFSLLTEILEGIAYLHSEGIIHRDLKPQNVLILHHRGRYMPKITDFGISKQLDDGQSSAVSNSVLGGTRSYASPEQLKDSKIRKNTDLWSFGVIAFQMLVGKLPFDCGKYSATSEEGRLELFRQMTSGVLPEALNNVPEPWQRLIRECLTVDNERRIAHAEDCLAIIRGGDALAVDPEPIAIPVEAVEVIPTPKPAPQPTPAPKVEPKSTPKPKPSAPATPAPKKRSKWWLWLLLLAIVGGGVFAYLSSQPKDNPEPPDKSMTIVPDTIEEVDSVEVIAPIEEVDSVDVVAPIEMPEPILDPILSLSKREINVPYSRTNGDIGYTVENPIDGVSVRVSENEDWLFTSVDEDIIRYTVTQNDLSEQRSTTFTVSYGGQSFEVAITQSGKPASAPTPAPDPVLRLTSNSRVTVEHGGGNGTIRYSLENPVSGVNLSVSDDARWLTTSRSGNTISYSASANESQSSRTATITVSYGDQSFDVVVTQNGKPAPIYAVGDYYNVNGVEGVVFEISDGGRHGKIVSVDQAELRWGPRRVDAPANSATNGEAITDAIMSLSDRDRYPAFTWCRSKGPNWYLPASDELRAIRLNKDAINATLRARGYTVINSGRYWSSTEFNEFCAWVDYINDDNFGYDTKPSRNYVRAVSAF